MLFFSKLSGQIHLLLMDRQSVKCVIKKTYGFNLNSIKIDEVLVIYVF